MNSLQSIHLHARSLPDSEQRSRFLDVACAADPALRQQIEHLLRDDSVAAGFFGDQETQDDDRLREDPPAAVTRPLPEQIGPYRILERIGFGGMGEVYRAEQRQPIRREVALKVVKLGMDTRQVVARFEAERQALALMDHPHIAKVYGADADEKGRPYFAMEYVKGVPITEYADNNHLTVRERLELFQQVCHAIQHAHQKGVIHRDIKPTNILVSTQDGRPHAKVIDFGIAKATAQQLTDKTLFTLHDQFIGTPQYMSPEQATGSLDIDTRADVYSLGVLLYELLTGHTPFDTEKLRKAALGEIARIIREDEPPKPSTRLGTLANPASGNPQGPTSLATLAKARSLDPQQLIKEVRGELDWMVMRAMDKDRARRYETPKDFAEDVGRHLSGQAVEAAPPSVAYRARKFTKRYGSSLLLGTVVLALLVGTASLATLGFIKERKARSVANQATLEASNARAEAESKADDLMYSLYCNGLQTAQNAIETGNCKAALAALDSCPEEFRTWEWRCLRATADSSLETFDFPPQLTQICGISTCGAYCVLKGPAIPPNEMVLWSAMNGQEAARISIPEAVELTDAGISVEATKILIIGLLSEISNREASNGPNRSGGNDKGRFGLWIWNRSLGRIISFTELGPDLCKPGDRPNVEISGDGRFVFITSKNPDPFADNNQLVHRLNTETLEIQPATVSSIVGQTIHVSHDGSVVSTGDKIILVEPNRVVQAPGKILGFDNQSNRLIVERRVEKDPSVRITNQNEPIPELIEVLLFDPLTGELSTLLNFDYNKQFFPVTNGIVREEQLAVMASSSTLRIGNFAQEKLLELRGIFGDYPQDCIVNKKLKRIFEYSSDVGVKVFPLPSRASVERMCWLPYGSSIDEQRDAGVRGNWIEFEPFLRNSIDGRINATAPSHMERMRIWHSPSGSFALAQSSESGRIFLVCDKTNRFAMYKIPSKHDTGKTDIRIAENGIEFDPSESAVAIVEWDETTRNAMRLRVVSLSDGSVFSELLWKEEWYLDENSSGFWKMRLVSINQICILRDGSIHLINARNGDFIKSLKGNFRDISLNHDGTKLAAANPEEILILSVPELHQLAKFSLPRRDHLDFMKWSPSGDRLIFKVIFNSSLTILDTLRGKPLFEIPVRGQPNLGNLECISQLGSARPGNPMVFTELALKDRRQRMEAVDQEENNPGLRHRAELELQRLYDASSTWAEVEERVLRAPLDEPMRRALFIALPTRYAQFDRYVNDRLNGLPRDLPLKSIKKLLENEKDSKVRLETLARFGKNLSAQSGESPVWLELSKPDLPKDRLDQLYQLTQMAFESSPESTEFRALLGAINYRKGRFPETIRQLRSIQWTESEDSVTNWRLHRYIMCFLAMAEAKLGHTNEAEKALEVGMRYWDTFNDSLQVEAAKLVKGIEFRVPESGTNEARNKIEELLVSVGNDEKANMLAEVSGTVVHVAPTIGGIGANIFIDSVNPERGMLVWIDFRRVPDVKLSDYTSLQGRKIVVEGSPGRYGGARQDLKNHAQLTITKKEDLRSSD